jgi:phosphatidylglycerophosphatase A
MKSIIEILATFFGCGYVPKLPGTAASLVTAILVWWSLGRLSLTNYCLLLVGVTILGVVVATGYDQLHKTHDSTHIVIDEVAGQMLALLPVVMVGAQHPVLAVAAGLGLFRFFDIKKPLGIYQIQTLPAGWGVMADDILAGVYSAIILGGLAWIGL